MYKCVESWAEDQGTARVHHHCRHGIENTNWLYMRMEAMALGNCIATRIEADDDNQHLELSERPKPTMSPITLVALVVVAGVAILPEGRHYLVFDTIRVV